MPDPKTAQRAKQKTCVCGHVPVHHDKRKSILQGIMADYKVIWACGWTGCGCPRFVEAHDNAEARDRGADLLKAAMDEIDKAGGHVSASTWGTLLAAAECLS